MWTSIARLSRETDGQDLIEYGLLAALISIVAVIAIGSVGPVLIASYNKIAADLQ